MRSRPEDLDEDLLSRALATAWGIDVTALEYAPVGAGSHHWHVRDRAGRRWFVTVDDLDQKAWFGDGRERALAGLRSAYQTAITLRDGGLDFVVAPIRTREGEPLRRLSARYSLAVLPFVDGTPGEFGQYAEAERAAIPELLARLHAQAPAAAAELVPRLSLAIPGRASLELALRALDQPWTGGPLSEDARSAVSARSFRVAEKMSVADRLAAEVATSADWVVTHGEPHGGNVMSTADGYVLIDWDTVAIAPRERDLWMLVPPKAVVGPAFAGLTGRPLDAAALSYFRLRWNLADIAAYTDELRRPHVCNEDAERALANLRLNLDAL